MAALTCEESVAQSSHAQNADKRMSTSPMRTLRSSTPKLDCSRWLTAVQTRMDANSSSRPFVPLYHPSDADRIGTGRVPRRQAHRLRARDRARQRHAGAPQDRKCPDRPEQPTKARRRCAMALLMPSLLSRRDHRVRRALGGPRIDLWRKAMLDRALSALYSFHVLLRQACRGSRSIALPPSRRD